MYFKGMFWHLASTCAIVNEKTWRNQRIFISLNYLRAMRSVLTNLIPTVGRQFNKIRVDSLTDQIFYDNIKRISITLLKTKHDKNCLYFSLKWTKFLHTRLFFGWLVLILQYPNTSNLLRISSQEGRNFPVLQLLLNSY